MDDGSSPRDKDICNACSLAATMDALEDFPVLPDLTVLDLAVLADLAPAYKKEKRRE